MTDAIVDSRIFGQFLAVTSDVQDGHSAQRQQAKPGSGSPSCLAPCSVSLCCGRSALVRMSGCVNRDVGVVAKVGGSSLKNHEEQTGFLQSSNLVSDSGCSTEGLVKNPENRPGSLIPKSGQSRTLHEGTMSEETEHEGKKAERREVCFFGSDVSRS